MGMISNARYGEEKALHPEPEEKMPVTLVEEDLDQKLTEVAVTANNEDPQTLNKGAKPVSRVGIRPHQPALIVKIAEETKLLAEGGLSQRKACAEIVEKYPHASLTYATVDRWALDGVPQSSKKLEGKLCNTVVEYFSLIT